MGHEVESGEIFSFLSSISYPATKDEVINTAYHHNATDDVLLFLTNISNRRYVSPNDLDSEIQIIKRQNSY